MKPETIIGFYDELVHGGHMHVATMVAFDDELMKIAADLTEHARDQIKGKNFALPGRRYPIEDAAHARNALARVSQHGTPEEKETVRKRVAAKWPGVIGDETKKDLKEKKSFAVTERGHKHDAAMYRLKAKHEAEKGELMHKQDALGYRKAGGGIKPGNLLNVLRFTGGGGHPGEKVRHYEYAAKKHEKGQNAYNPWGGSFTPSSHEQHGSRFLYGKLKSKKS